MKRGHVSLKIFNTLGNEIVTLIEGEQDKGFYALNYNASQLSSGVYFYKFTANGFCDIHKMILIK